MYRCYDWLLNGAHKHVAKGKHHTDTLRKYIKIMGYSRDCNGEQVDLTFKHFHSRKISMNKYKGHSSVNQIFDHLFQNTLP